MSEMLTGPKKIVDGLTEVFRGLTQMCEGMAEQIELLEFTADDVTEEDKLIPPAKLPPVDTAPKGQEMPHPRKKPVKRMKTGRNLQEVLVELDRQNKAKQDFISPAQGMRLREDGHTFELNHLTTDRQMTFGTTSLFHRQVASALGIPAKYYDLMQSQKPELLAENVNAWFADRTSSYMVRSMDYGSGQVARALLSERYRRIDNMEIATSVLPLFAGNDQYEVMSCEVTENRLYLKVVNHRLEMEVRKGDIVQAGVMISNSEVGLGAVSIQPLVYRLVCTNGMVVNDMGERRHHVGRQAKAVEDSFTLYSDETMEAEDKAFLLKLRDTTMAAIDEARFAQVVGRLQESMAVPITGKVQDVIQNIGQKGGLDHERRNTSR